MPRPGRASEAGRIYHVYNCVGGDGMPFRDKDFSNWFVWLLKKMVERDGLLVYAWVLMDNHYHLGVRMGAPAHLPAADQRLPRFCPTKTRGRTAAHGESAPATIRKTPPEGGVNSYGCGGRI